MCVMHQTISSLYDCLIFTTTQHLCHRSVLLCMIISWCMSPKLFSVILGFPRWHFSFLSVKKSFLRTPFPQLGKHFSEFSISVLSVCIHYSFRYIHRLGCKTAINSFVEFLIFSRSCFTLSFASENHCISMIDLPFLIRLPFTLAVFSVCFSFRRYRNEHLETVYMTRA